MKKKEFNFDLKQLRSFLAILDENSFTKASRKLKIGQATISNHIQMLEDMLSVKLVKRTSKEFIVTPEGELFKEFCEKLFADIDKLKVDIGDKTFGGVISLSASTIPASYILPGAIGEIKKIMPDLFFRIEISDSREVIEKIKEGKIEVGVTGKLLKHPFLQYDSFLNDEIVLIGPADSPDSINLDKIKNIPLIIRESGSGTRNAYEKVLIEKNITPSELNVVFESCTSEGVKESVISGIGYTFISKLAIKRELDLNVLKIISIKNIKIKRNLYIVYQNNRKLSNVVLKLIEILKKIK